MELLVLLFVSLLLRSCGAQGPTPVFVKTGEDLPLSFTKADGLGDFISVGWMFNKKDFLVRFVPGRDLSMTPRYKGRIDVNEESYSVILKNLQDSDSGLYTARLDLGEGDQTLAEYNVTVQDPVSPVQLSVDSVSNSSGSCNFTVSCRTQDSHINSSITCDTQSCSQDGGEQSKVTTSGALLQVHLGNGSVICNHSNQVSWTEEMKMIKTICCQNADGSQPHRTDPVLVVIGVIIPLAAIIIISVTVWCYRKRRNGISQNMENTVYEVPQVGTTTQRLNPYSACDAAGQSPNSTYCLVGQHTGPGPQTRDPNPNQNPPESLYARVEKPARTVER